MYCTKRNGSWTGQGLWAEEGVGDVSHFIFNLFVLSSNLFPTSALGLFVDCPLQSLKRAALYTIGFLPYPHHPWIGQVEKLANQHLPQNSELKDADTIGRWWWTLWLESQGWGISKPCSQQVNERSRWEGNWEQMCKEKQRWGAM